MPRGRSRECVFEQIKSIKGILEPIISHKETTKIRALVMRCTKYQTKLITSLTSEESRAYDLLLKNGINPKRAYGYLLLEDVPQHIREKILARTISLDNARRQFVKWKKMNHAIAGANLMEDMRRIVRCLRWDSQETSI